MPPKKLIIVVTLLSFMRSSLPQEDNVSQSTEVPALSIGWHEGSIVEREKGKYTFVPVTKGESVNAYKAPIHRWISEFPSLSGPGANTYWLGAYCSSAREYRLLFEAVLKIHAEIGLDPYPDYWSFPGKGFYFIGGMNRNPDSLNAEQDAAANP